jgi:arylsulfatase A-like enzyme
MMKKTLLTLAVAALSIPSALLAEQATPASSTPASTPAPANTQKQPNIIFFLMDDLGWKDLSCMGSTFYESPAIDQLAADGFRFTRGYEAAPRCVPSRLSILTGKDHNRPELRGETGLPLDQVVYASLFKDAGYSTFFAGKWHEGQKGFWPQDNGFEINKGGCSLGALATHFWPYTLPDKPVRHGPREDHNTAPSGWKKGSPASTSPTV